MNEARRQDRQKKRMEDNVKEWTGLNFAVSKSSREQGVRCPTMDYQIIRPQGHKTFFILNSTEPEIYPANTSEEVKLFGMVVDVWNV